MTVRRATPPPRDAARRAARLRANVPRELRDMRVWLGYRLRPKADRPGKFDKVPYYVSSGEPRCGRNGNPVDRARLAGFDDAIEACRLGRFDGPGVAVLAGVPFWALDLDACIAPNGARSPLAERTVKSGAYCERSPSGRGVRALFAGKCGAQAKNNAAGVETFEESGFVTITGDRLGGRDLIPCPPALLAEVLAIVSADGKRGGAPAGPTCPVPEGADLSQLHLPAVIRRRLRNPYPPGCDRSREAFLIALDLARCGATPAQALELMAHPDLRILTPALERRRGNIASARQWLWRYVVSRAFEEGGARGR